MITSQQLPKGPPESAGVSPLVKRIGTMGFLFFLIKGLAWMIVPAVLLWFGLS